MMKRLLLRTSFAVLLVLFTSITARASVTLNSTNFPDTNFKDALSAITGVAEGGTINEATLTELDVSNQGITNLTGLGLLTGLTSLDISGNSGLTTGADITGLTALTTLKASNCNLATLSATSSGNYAGLTIGSSNSNITYLDVSNNANLVTANTAFGYLTKLETLKMHHCTSFDYWGTAGNYMSSLKYVDVSYCTNMDRIYLKAAENLEVLKAMGLIKLKGFRSKSSYTSSQQYYIVLAHNSTTALTTLKWLDVSGCSQLNSIYLAKCSSLEHLNAEGTKLDGFSSYAGLNGGEPSEGYIQLFTGLNTLEYLNLANCSSLTQLAPLASKYEVSCIDTLILANDTGLAGWSSGITAQTGLKYCDLTNTGQTSTSIGFTSAFTSLETLILANNSNFGWSESFKHLSALKYLDISGCNLFFRKGTDSDPKLLYYLTPANNPLLETLLANNSQMGSLTEGLTGFQNLKTVNIAGNSGAAHFWVNDCPAIETLNISGCSGLTYLKLNNDGLPRSTFTLAGGSGCTALTSLYLEDNNYGSSSNPNFNGLSSLTHVNSLYLNGNNYSSVGDATSDFSDLSAMRFLYLENNNFGGGELTLTAAECGNLTGLDLDNNGFTSFNAPSLPQSLTALMIGDNPSMERLEMHNNPGITKMTASPTMSDGSGLYLLGNTALHYMDISGNADQPNYFKHIGNNGSFYGVPIKTLKASYNKFYSFRNLTEVPGCGFEYWGEKVFNDQGEWVSTRNVYHLDTNGNLEGSYRFKSAWRTEVAQPDSASLEQLPNLEYLDLSHCQLKDSVYLHKNTELRYLDVSHNRSIYRSIYSGSSNPKYQKGAEFRQYLTQHTAPGFTDYKKYMWLASNTDIREYFTNDCNDTTGLYILDLLDNNKLEYLDISYTGIEQTAMTHCHVANARYIWIQDLPYLKYFYANYNGMRSMGIGTKNGKKRPNGDGDYTPTEGLKSLERLSVIGMRGTDKTTMQGSINFSSPYAATSPSPCVNLHYINLSYSKFDSIGVKNPHVDTLIIRGNPIHKLNLQEVDAITYVDARECAYKTRGLDIETGDIFYSDINVYKNGARKGGSYSGAETSPLSGLREVRAYKRHKLTTMLLDNCNALTKVYCFKDSVLPKIHGFENLAYNKDYDASYGFPTQDADSLQLVWVNNDISLTELNLTKNVNLKYLHAYNDKALGTALSTNGMDLSPNQNLITAWVSNSNLQRFTNYAGQRSTQEHLDTLKIWQNPELSELDVTKYNNLRYLDLRNCMVNVLDVNSNSKLTYFDCSNMDSTSTDFVTWNNYGFTMPKAVPTSLTQPGKNSIADLNFSSTSLEVVHADNNDLYRMTGLNANPNLNTLTYSFNHINAIDLNGCTGLPLPEDEDVDEDEYYKHYDCRHNVRGVIPGELSVWQTTENGERIEHKMYYFQLEKNAGDAIQPNYNTFLGSKSGDDTLRIVNGIYQLRKLEDDGFDPTKVLRFTVNSSGPYVGSRGREGNTPSGAPSRVIVEPGEDLQLDLSTIYGTIAVLKYMDPDRNYIEYLYNDGRSGSSKAEGGSGFGLAWGAPSVPTDVEEIAMDGLGEPTVVSERYYDAAGIEHSEPIKGVNIVVRQMSDGSTQTVKVLK